MELLPPTEFTHVPHDLIEPIAKTAPSGEAQHLIFPSFGGDAINPGKAQEELWQACFSYASWMRKQFDPNSTKAIVALRKLTAEPGQSFIAPDDTKGWHVDDYLWVSLTDEKPCTDQLVGEIDREKAAKVLGGAMLESTIPGSDEFTAQVALLNAVEDVLELPGANLEIKQFHPYQALITGVDNVHRRPLLNPLNYTVTRLFVNALFL